MGTTPVAKPQPLAAEKKKRTRSPNYPTIGLKEAIERVRRFYDQDGRAGAKADMAARHIGFASAHGQAYSVLSALKKFGLVEDKDGRVVPTTRSIEIISLPETDERRARAIRQAALSPVIYSDLINEYKSAGRLPHDETLAGELEAYKGFNPNAVREFLKSFRETLEFSGLSDFSVLDSESKAGDAGKPGFKIGDYVQWEPNGILQFHEAKRVTGLSDDGHYLFVEGYNTGLPISEVSPADPQISEIQSNPPPGGKGAGVRGGQMRQDVFSLAEGEVILRWPTPLSSESIADLKDWLKILERKIGRSEKKADPSDESNS